MTQNLIPLLQAAETPRLIYLSSLAHKFTFSFDINSYNNASRLPGHAYYATSKLMAVLMANGLAARHKDFSVNSVHPGTVNTEFKDKYSGIMLSYVFPAIYALFERPLEQGAATQVLVASSPEAGRVSGKYWSNCMPWKQNPVAENPQLCRQFIELCDELIRPHKL